MRAARAAAELKLAAEQRRAAELDWPKPGQARLEQLFMEAVHLRSPRLAMLRRELAAEQKALADLASRTRQLEVSAYLADIREARRSGAT